LNISHSRRLLWAVSDEAFCVSWAVMARRSF
jgi:hypothetical protein